jgi:hypothetical protein
MSYAESTGKFYFFRRLGVDLGRGVMIDFAAACLASTRLKKLSTPGILVSVSHTW